MNKLLIANRGEIACRIMRTAKNMGLSTVAVYSEADASALHVTSADEAVLLGPAKAQESYLVSEKILAAAESTGADAIHPGYGFLAENAQFAQQVIDAGLIWVGPAPEQIDAMGDKERAKIVAQQVSVPTLPGSARIESLADVDIASMANEVGYPMLVKACAGGGGIGMRLVNNADELVKVVEGTQTMAERSFGDGSVFLERYIPKARHVEVQIFGFGDGRAVHLFERDCSIQRRFQKVIEESPAPNLPNDVREAMARAAVAFASSQNYLGAGTVEFVVDADTKEFFFLEMNTRIQVEHPVTEMVTGHDIVALQLGLASGSKIADLTQDNISSQGHSIECRIYAENPDKMFLPSPGELATYSMPEQSANIRIDTGVSEGDTITPYYDPMIAKLVCYGASRELALAEMRNALEQVKIEGIANNVKFLQRAIVHSQFASGDVFTGFIDANKDELIG
ncbi:MAG: acetyl-CoA carboxylase biotin carboxylase subunit [Gammaproteobacteria bacterium]